jgi:hypothetical protein
MVTSYLPNSVILLVVGLCPYTHFPFTMSKNALIFPLGKKLRRSLIRGQRLIDHHIRSYLPSMVDEDKYIIPFGIMGGDGADSTIYGIDFSLCGIMSPLFLRHFK